MPTENRKPQTANHPSTATRLFCIITFGCKVNQCDTAGLAQELAARGWLPAPPAAPPDLLLVNTCTVTARADQQARQVIRRLAREHPGAPLWVTGCYAQRAPEEVAALPGVTAVLGNREKSCLAALTAHIPPAAISLAPNPPSPGERWGGEAPTGQKIPPIQVGSYSPDTPFHPWRFHAAPGQTRARLKIQEGCSHQCTYCIVPRVRGPRRSMAPEQVQAALQDLQAAGYREVVLTGVDLGHYGQDLSPPGSLAGLVQQLQNGAAVPERLRFSSLEPQEVTPALLRALAGLRQFCPHFHLPLQSGAAEVLAAMGRPYRPGDFRELCLAIHRLFPDAALGLDILVGFPGETAAAFETTRELVGQLPATYLHVFPYSPRPGTPAALMPPVPAPEVQRRARIMRELGARKLAKFQHSQLGQIREVLVEGPAAKTGWLKGLSDNYLRVLLPGAPECRNHVLRVRLRKIEGGFILGEAVE